MRRPSLRRYLSCNRARRLHPIRAGGPSNPVFMRIPRDSTIRVAIVAASLRILGGQAVQAKRLLDNWKDDPDVEAWLVPINPVPHPPFHALLAVKFLRT